MAGFKSKSTANTFMKGMNLDVDKSLMASDTYRYAENLRLITDSNGNSGSLENVKGTIGVEDLRHIRGTIIGHCTIRNFLVIFSATTNDSTSLSGIYVYDTNNSIERMYIRKYVETIPILNLRTDYQVSTVGRYESDTLIKVYFVDGLHGLRFVNIAKEMMSLTIEDFEALPNSNLNSLRFDSLVNGILKAGRIQYAYQLFNTNGSETAISSLTGLINLTEINNTISSSSSFKGSEYGTNTGVGIKLSLPQTTGLSKYDSIRIYSIFYNTLNQVPTIKVINEQKLVLNSQVNLYFYDYGTTTIEEITLDEFISLNNIELVANILDTKNNRLFLANVTEKYWNIDLSDYDTRAYRFNKQTIPKTRVYTTDDTFRDYRYSQVRSISKSHDCINTYNDLNYNTTGKSLTNDDYAYTKDGELGGSGVNISFTINYDSNIISDCNSSYNPESPNVTKIYQNVESYGTLYGIVKDGFSGYANPYKAAQYVTYARDEVYRFGIVFYNTKGQPSSVNWIADIRMPSNLDYPFLSTTNPDPNLMQFNTLFIAFYLDNIDKLIAKGVTSYEIVRVERTRNDKSVISSGVLGWTVNHLPDGATDVSTDQGYINSKNDQIAQLFPYNRSTFEDKSYNLGVFVSPDVNFDEEFDKNDIEYVERIGGLYGSNGNGSGSLYCTNEKADGTLANIDDMLTTTRISSIDMQTPAVDNAYLCKRSFLVRPHRYSGDFYRGKVNVLETKLCRPNNGMTYDDQPTYMFSNNVTYKPWFCSRFPYSRRKMSPFPGGISGTKLIMRYGNGEFLFNANNINNNFITLANLRKNNAGQYGGNSYQSRTLNKYISCGDRQDITTAIGTGMSSRVYGGDIYTVVHDCLWSSVDNDSNMNTTQVIALIPCESSYNTSYTNGNSYTKLTNVSTPRKFFYLQENPGAWLFGEETIFQTKSYYLYNTVYSQINNTQTFSATSDYENKNNVYDSRIYYSGFKYNNEISDNWTKYKPLNFLEVDSKYGPINAIYMFNNRMYYWQNSAFGWVSINERELLPATNGSQLVLGTGSILDRYDYLSTVNGCVHKNSICSSDSVLYWYDATNNEQLAFSGNGVERLSKTKGVQSYFNNLKNIDVTVNVTSEYDTKYNEVLLHINNTSNSLINKTLIYSEALQCYTSFFTMSPDIFLNLEKGLFSIYNKYLYKHNTGDRCDFYGTVKDSMLKILVNEGYSTTKTFDSIEYASTAISSTSEYNLPGFDRINYLTDTFNTVCCYNDYQNTGLVSLVYNDTLRRKERGFTLNVPRNILDADVDTNPNLSSTFSRTLLYKERLTDKYLYTDFYYDNEQNNVFNISYITTNYRISIR